MRFHGPGAKVNKSSQTSRGGPSVSLARHGRARVFPTVIDVSPVADKRKNNRALTTKNVDGDSVYYLRRGPSEVGSFIKGSGGGGHPSLSHPPSSPDRTPVLSARIIRLMYGCWYRADIKGPRPAIRPSRAAVPPRRFHWQLTVIYLPMSVLIRAGAETTTACGRWQDLFWNLGRFLIERGERWPDREDVLEISETSRITPLTWAAAHQYHSWCLVL